MTYGIVFKSPNAFTGDYVDTLPVVTDPPYALPVGGLESRFLATHGVNTGSAGSVTWRDQVGSITLAAAGTATSPTVEVVDGRKALTFDGVSDELRYDFAANKAQPFTIALVVKNNQFVASGSGTRVFVGGTKLGASRVNEAGALQVSNTTGLIAYGGTLMAAAGPSYGSITPTGWHVFVASFNGAGTATRVDGYARTGSAGVLPRSALSVGGEANSFYADCSISEVATWNRALTAQEITDVVTAMRAQYGI
ncbi:hypothetical protein PP356_gp26 [Arthrobacter phage MargaretKali]|uniref:LamG domain-containing protein n=1 Tax=Arthrobacter phage MargaretKali TaxID=2250414 RepID=A0A345KN04_9CAUD|nr:hypothetical protein PP356_gp26 [Arthrobacter phage MargaretKali]AXH44406.1 hypothetical protein SEA_MARGARETKALI_26 [Arthrobacter phage MargaretKali]